MLEQFKKWVNAYTITLGFIAIVSGGFLFGADIKKKLDAGEKAQQAQFKTDSTLTDALTKLAQAQAKFQEDMTDFILNLWNVDPEQRKKWSVIPQQPIILDNGDTLRTCEWRKFEGHKRLLLYKFEAYVDTVADVMKWELKVDTLFDTERN